MWYEALPAVIATTACLSLVEISPFVFHYLSWGCPMMRNANGEVQHMMLRRDQRIADQQGIRWHAPHQYTFSFNTMGKRKETGNYSEYVEAEKRLGAGGNTK